MGYGPPMTPDYRPSLIRSFERHLRAENRSEHTIASYLESLRQAEAFLASRGLVDARRRGKHHPHAIRILARAWLRVSWACWHTDTADDPARHRAEQRLAA
jgi:hypothetical protein